MTSKKKFFSNFIWRFLERCGAQVVTFVVSIVLARLLDPVVYGTVALVTVITTILQVFVDSGLGNALIQKKNADDTDFSTVFYFNILVCAILYTGLFFAAPFIANFYEMPELTPVIRVLGTILIISGVKNVQQAYVSKHLLFKRFFWATLGGTISAAVVGIWMAYKGYGVWALVAQYLVNAAMDTIILWITVKFRPKLLFSWKRLGGLFKYGWKLLVSALLDTGYTELRSLIIGKKYSSEDLAFYNKGGQFPKVIATNINSSIDSVLLPVMSEEQDNRERVKMMTRRAIKTSSFILWPLMMGLAACAEPIVSLLLTDKWLPCVLFMRVFCITYAFYPIHTANLNAIKAMGRSDLFLILEIIKKAIGLGLILGFMWISVEAMAYSCIIASVTSQIINSWPNKKLLKYSYLEQLKDILPSIGLSVFMAGCVYCVSFLHLNNWLTLLIQVPLGAIIYILGAKIFKFEAFVYLLSMVKGFFNKKNISPVHNPYYKANDCGEDNDNVIKTKCKKYLGKKILILGATAQTIPFITKAKEMGIITYVADHLPNSPAKEYADYPLLINCFDIDALEQAIRSYQIDGILLGCADILLPCYVELCNRTQKPCYATAEQVSVLGNKKGLKECLRSFDLPVIPEYSLNQVLNHEIPEENFPIFIKPVDNCSSKGMSICNSYKDFEMCYEKAINASRSKTVLIEKMMLGDDISITYTFSGGKIYVTSIADRYVNREQKGLGTITTALIYPSKYTNLYFSTIHEKVCKMFEFLKIQNGVLTIQAFVDKGEIMFYDPAFRTTGGQGYIIYDYFKCVDQIKLLIEFSLDGDISNIPISDECNFKGNYAANLVILIKPGKIKDIVGLSDINKITGVINVTQCHFAGDEIKNKGTLDQTLTRIHIVSETKEKLKSIIIEILNKMDVFDENGESMLLRQFNVNEMDNY